MLREQVTTEKDEMERESTKVKGDEMVKAQMLQAHLSAVDLSHRLGLRFEIGDAEELRFFYRHVTRRITSGSSWWRSGWWTPGGYELMDCDTWATPRNGCWRNATGRTTSRDLSHRRQEALPSERRREEVAAAAAALREKAKVSAPGYAPADEAEPGPRARPVATHTLPFLSARRYGAAVS